MAFHFACPLTCRKICYCAFGGDPNPLRESGRKKTSLQIAAALQKLIASTDADFGGEKAVSVLVPCLPKDVKKNKQKLVGGHPAATENAEDGPPTTAPKRAVGHKRTPVSSVVAAGEATTTTAEKARKAGGDGAGGGATGQSADVGDFAKSYVRGGTHRTVVKRLVVSIKQHGAEGAPNVDDSTLPRVPRLVCGLCSVEVIGREREKRALSCHACGKKYHRKCVKQWAEHRDLFNWASWVCPSCRSCEVCRRPGEVDKLMFCKRCDVARHVYCQQPPLKHVPKGPYLCPKHTCCHSCASVVPGSGVSSRWFMSFTTCDACGRLFVKDKYCPVCLKVYRDSEATPMVRCDSCEHWVHCRCDGISDEKFNQFEHDDNLQYKCAACRGDCHKVNGIDDAVRELWKRRDKSDAEQRARLGAAARLPSKEEMMKLYPSSDDEKHPALASQGSVHHGSRMVNDKKRKKPVVLSSGGVGEQEDGYTQHQFEGGGSRLKVH